ncbi:hypothetical protein [Pseudothioclava nitratireducens]|uniref:hypothetical protein n=1 Tax=Pseudothioclava nitratireducens TaxID=1928646 RepID=UPI0023DA7A37|nr:hypothetical protein [Defluviimonas nitratireducens]MDF1621747.1 hypothetical protein [Defluviimonas nitratireducens]
MRFGDGFTETRSYDQSYRLTGLRDSDGITVLRDLALSYDLRDNLIGVLDLLDASQSETFGYTPREHLASASGPYGALGFAYDGVGNRISYSFGDGADHRCVG